MDQPKLISKAFFVIFCAIFFMILAGFIGGRLIDESQRQTVDAMADVTQSMMVGGAMGLLIAFTLILKLRPEQFVHASVILFAGFLFEIVFISIVNYFHLSISLVVILTIYCISPLQIFYRLGKMDNRCVYPFDYVYVFMGARP